MLPYFGLKRDFKKLVSFRSRYHLDQQGTEEQQRNKYL
jgi:hypothetical protein